MPDISIIVPVYNSRTILPKLLSTIDRIKKNENWDLELILIDDGSQDGSFNTIKNLSSQYNYIYGIRLSRNFGHQAAVRTGLIMSKGNYIAIIDDDMQDPPDLLPTFFKYLENGYDVAYGVRRKRKENFIKKSAYKLFYKLINRLSEITLPLDSGDFCVMKRKVLESMLMLHERNPYLRGIRAWVGFNQIGVEYERNERAEGKSGYTFKKLLKIASDGIYSFSDLPLRLTSYFGIAGMLLCIIYGFYILTKYILFGVEMKGFTTLALLILFFGSINLISMGILGEYIGRIYAEGKNRPDAIIAETIDKR